MHAYLSNLSILLIIFSCYPIGRIIGVSGYLPSAISGLIIISTPIAILANFNASWSSFLVQILPVILLLVLTLIIVNTITRSVLKVTISLDKILFFIVGLICCAFIVFWTYTFNSTERYYFDSHEYYFAAVPLELHIAEYASRLRIFFAYPYEWSQYYFLQGASLALVTSLVDDPNFFTIRLAKFTFAIITFAALAEMLWHYSDIFNKKGSVKEHSLKKKLVATSAALLILFAMLSSIYHFAFTTGFQANSFLSFVCVMCFAITRMRLKFAESYVWILLLTISQIKTLPVCVFGTIIMMYYDGTTGSTLTWKSPQKLFHKTCEFFAANKYNGVVILGLLTVCSIYSVATMMTPASNHSGSPFGFQSSFPYGWWIAVPEISLIKNLWDFVASLLIERAAPLQSHINEEIKNIVSVVFNKVGNLAYPLAILGSSWLAVKYIANRHFKIGVYSLVTPTVILAFYIEPFAHPQVVSIFSFMLLVAFVIIVVTSRGIKAVAVCSTMICLSFYLSPVSFFLGGIVRVAPPRIELASTSEMHERIIDKNDIRVRSNFKQPRDFVYCSADEPFHNEAVGGQLGRRVALTDQNLSQRQNPTIIHRHISELNEAKLPILSSCLMSRK